MCVRACVCVQCVAGERMCLIETDVSVLLVK